MSVQHSSSDRITDLPSIDTSDSSSVVSPSETALLESITCSITASVMTDPVSTPSGHTYERSAITEWLSRNPSSPQTRQHTTSNNLQPNTTIRYLCDKYNNGELGPTVNQVNRAPPKVSSEHIKLDHNSYRGNNNNQLMLSFNIVPETFPKDCEHLSQDVVLIIDHSGSMGSNLEAKSEDGNLLENGFSVQDIVNHAAKTVTKTLDSKSRLSIIVFDSVVDVITSLMPMSDINKSTSINRINSIQPRSQTNIYAAIEKAIEILDERTDKSNNSAILMLTDGIPNIEPARGTVDTLQKLRHKKNFTAPIYTFGFGYSLRRGLLYDIAKSSNGGYGHIPDGTMIATVFCNFIATVLSTVVMNLQLHIVTSNYSNIKLMGDTARNITDNEIIYDLGTVQYQQTRDIILEVSETSSIQYYFTYKIGGASYQSDYYNYEITSCSPSPSFNDNLYRCQLIESIRCMINYATSKNFTEVNDAFQKIKEALTSAPSSVAITGMLQNLIGDNSSEGQIKLAVDEKYFNKWGEYYLDQLSRSLNQQIKPNFKDTACIFGGDVFNQIVDKSSDIFDSIPPPTPSNAVGSRYPYTSNGPTTPARPVDMSVYNNAGGSCFTGDSLILLANQSQKCVKDLKKNDSVLTLVDPYNHTKGFAQAKVICVLKTITNGHCKLVTTKNGLKITPWHPIISHSIWCFPESVAETKVENCNEVYSILLDNYHTFNLNGSWVIGLGHNYKIGILNHDYFGTNKIIEDMKKCDDWQTGTVTIRANQIIRDPISNEICGFNTNTNTNTNYIDNSIYNSKLLIKV